MAFWFAFFMWVGTSILSALFAKPRIESARPSGLDDFQVPTATEGRAVPIIVGKVQCSGPNVAWYGDLRADAITEEVGGFLGIGGQDVTKGYRYRIGVQMVISTGPIGGIDRVWMGDKIIYDAGETSGDIVVDLPEFFGGEDSGGGIDFTLQMRFGEDDQPISAYLDSQLALTPRYQNIVYAILYDGVDGPGYIGNSPSLRNIAFEAFWYPNTLAVTGGKERIGDDANPICFLYEVLVANDDWGIALSAGDVLVTGSAAEGALRALAEQVADEGLGFSMIIDRPMTAADLIKEIERHVDGKFRLDLTDGRFKIILARPPVGAVTLFDESNIVELVSYDRPMWTETFNEVRVNYADRAKDYDQTFAFDQDLANLDITGRHRSHSLRFPGCKDAVVAGILASREMFSLGAPLARAKWRVKGQEYRTQIGDPCDFSWADHGVSELPMRVSRIRYGRDSDAEIEIDAVEDVFRLQAPGFADPPPTAWVEPSFDAVAALDARLWNAPRQLMPRQTVNSSPQSNVVVLVARNGGLHTEYDVYTDFDGGTDNFVLSNQGVGSWTPVAALDGALDADLGDVNPYRADFIDIDGLNDLTFSLLDGAANTTISTTAPRNIFLIDEEVLWYETVTDLGGGTLRLENVHRGAFGTIPTDHADNSRIWFPGFGAGAVLPPSQTLTASIIRCRVTPRTGTGTFPLATAPNIPLAADFTVSFDNPYAPGDMVVNTERFVDDDWSTTPGILRVTWRDRNRLTQAFDTKQDDAAVALPGLTGIRVRVRRADNDDIVAFVDSAIAGQFNGSNYLVVTTPGEILDQGGSLGAGGSIAELDHYIEAASVRSGKVSQEWVSNDFEVFGFGLDFGGNFGGQETGGANTGVVLDQGDAPFVVSPTPPSEIANRLYQIKVFNDLLSTEDVFVRISGFDATNQSSFVFQDTMDGSVITTAVDQAKFIRDLAVNGFAFASRPFTVVRTGTTIDIRGTEGSNVRFEARSSISGSSATVRSLNPPGNVEEALGAQVGVRGAYFLDWFQQIVDPVTGATSEELAPPSSANYANQAPSPLNVVQSQFNALTRSGEALVADIPFVPFTGISVGPGVASFGFNIANALSTSYDGIFSDIVAEFQDAPVGQLGDFFVGIIPGGTQTRTAVCCLAEQDLAMREYVHDRGQLPGPGALPFQLRFKESIAPVVEGPLSQATAFSWLTDENFGPLMPGQVLQAIINGTVFSATVSGPGGNDEVVDAVKDLVADINAGSEPVSAVFEPLPRASARMVVVHDSPGAGAVFDAQIWGGQGTNRIEFRIIDE